MIDYKDLAIGNYVKIYNGEIYQVESITYDMVGLVNSENSIEQIMCDRIYPIEVTDELLIKLGFVFNKYDETYDNRIRVRKGKWFDEYGVFCECEDSWYSDTHCPYFKYLHELQNIFRLITKKDLEVNL